MTRWLVASGLFVASALVCGDAAAQPAPAPPPPPPVSEPAQPPLAPDAWSTAYAEARRLLDERDYAAAAPRFRALAASAASDGDRRVALEMAHVAETLGAPPPSAETPLVIGPKRRTRDEITLLYTSAFVYGAGTGAWFLLQTQPDTALTATLPFIGITATPVVALALIDGTWPLPHGVPHAITAGLYLGLGEGIWLTGYQHARADRTGGARWDADRVATVLWGGATLGGIMGGAVAAALPTTPGRASFTASATVWSGVLTGMAFGAALPENGYRSEHALLAGGIGYNVGLLAGMTNAARVSPTITRMRLVDLSGAAGGLVVGGGYLAFANHAEPRATLGLTAAGAAAGLAFGWWATSGMEREVPAGAASGPARPAAPVVMVQPMVSPVRGGGVVGVAGAM